MSGNSSSGGGGNRAIAAAATASSPEVLPEWFGGLGLDKQEEEDLIAAFAALPEPPPPAAADAKLVQAAKDLVVSMKEPARAGVSPRKKRTRERAKKAARLPSGTENGPQEVIGKGEEEEGGGWVEVKVAAPRATGAGGASEAEEPTEEAKKPPVKEPLTAEVAGARDVWMQQRLGLDDGEMATMWETHTNVCARNSSTRVWPPRYLWVPKYSSTWLGSTVVFSVI